MYLVIRYTIDKGIRNAKTHHEWGIYRFIQ